MNNDDLWPYDDEPIYKPITRSQSPDSVEHKLSFDDTFAPTSDFIYSDTPMTYDFESIDTFFPGFDEQVPGLNDFTYGDMYESGWYQCQFDNCKYATLDPRNVTKHYKIHPISRQSAHDTIESIPRRRNRYLLQKNNEAQYKLRRSMKLDLLSELLDKIDSLVDDINTEHKWSDIILYNQYLKYKVKIESEIMAMDKHFYQTGEILNDGL